MIYYRRDLDAALGVTTNYEGVGETWKGKKTNFEGSCNQ